MEEEPTKKGFAALTKERLREIASMGGKASHRLGKAHAWNSVAAVLAGRKGGLKAQENKRNRKGEES